MGDTVWTFLGTVDAYNAKSCLRKQSIKNTEKPKITRGVTTQKTEEFCWVKQRSCTQK